MSDSKHTDPEMTFMIRLILHSNTRCPGFCTSNYVKMQVDEIFKLIYNVPMNRNVPAISIHGWLSSVKHDIFDWLEFNGVASLIKDKNNAHPGLLLCP